MLQKHTLKGGLDLAQMKFTRLLEDLISARNQSSIAEDIGVDSSTLSRFRSGESGLKADSLDRLCANLGLVIITQKDLDDLENALILITEKWKDSRSRG